MTFVKRFVLKDSQIEVGWTAGILTIIVVYILTYLVSIRGIF